MDCKIDGCGRPAMYQAQRVCQRHYFRFMRYGTYDLVGPRDRNGNKAVRKMRKSNAKGYQLVFEPSHPLAMRDGYVYEHRKVVYDLHGENLPPCEVCGAPTHWETCHVDHRDEVITNNQAINLRPLCRGCNTSRTERSTITKYEYAGKTMSLAQWAQQTGVAVGHNQLKTRIASGMPFEEALFAKNKTHPKAIRDTYRKRAKEIAP